ncbi:response regulator of the LytR/AlgR family [Owenweeksia hongkongensis DSM 17368]|uniref:Response regulator of the LytR/AlgR family n=1 Tax=Owenweeksia hongkongensis (strain DSM 17368 / CIP 108786 / JCM 12287 / NRRL B-23963 / UST20020801) TaxID=926562 RepID=G8R6Z7_OWEHD|nr:LytTR family DNA-binding domain-containing protein [Owenweeksia hongkongensis]AEV33362.1 response regulator of the LytR/AlgR family [Owenweeksia hongkongensis DSM 17368]
MKPLKCIIVDDDPLSREALRHSIGRHSDLRLEGSYHNALEAKMALAKKDLDLVFLDIEMPEMTGFELLNSYKNIPQVVLVTSNKDHAFEAFRYDVTDFISKPIDHSRFEQAVERVLRYSQSMPQRVEEHNLVIKSDGVLVKINAGDIDYVEAMGDYIKVVLADSNYVVHSTMKAFITQLPDAFLRVHKSYIVNLDKVLEIDDSYLVGEYFNLPVSRSYKNDVKTKFKEYL